jgi:hypothetical protein
MLKCYQLRHVISASIFPEYLITMGTSPTMNLEMQVVVFQEDSYALVATLTLGLHLESSCSVPVIFHQYFGRVRNRIVVWTRESDTRSWVISEFDVDFGSRHNEWFINEGSRRDTGIIKGIPLNRTSCMVIKSGEGAYAIDRVGRTQGKGQVSTLEGHYLNTYDLGPEGIAWVEWSGTLVELDQSGVYVFRYGLP